MFLFGSKVERQLLEFHRNCPEIEIKYAHGKKVVGSQIMKVNRDGFVILGFEGPLKESLLDVRVVQTHHTFVTKVVKKGPDRMGRMLFYCALPKQIRRQHIRVAQRYFVYPNGICKFLIDTNKGQKSVLCTVWDICQEGVSLVNEANVQFNVGTKIFNSFLKLENCESHLMNLQIRNKRRQEHVGKELEILGCMFTSESKALDKMLAAARMIDKEIRPKSDKKKK